MVLAPLASQFIGDVSGRRSAARNFFESLSFATFLWDRKEKSKNYSQLKKDPNWVFRKARRPL